MFDLKSCKIVAFESTQISKQQMTPHLGIIWEFLFPSQLVYFQQRMSSRSVYPGSNGDMIK